MISVVMPVFNPPLERLQESIRSIERQSVSDWELVIVDDGSTDEASIDFLDSVEKSDSRISLIRQANQGPSAARNAGTQLVRGDVVTYLDCDDEIPSSTFEMVQAALSVDPVDVLFAYVQLVKSEADKWNLAEPDAHRLSTAQLNDLRRRTVRGNVPVIERSGHRAILKNGPVARYVNADMAKRVRFPEDLKVSEDTIWNIRLFSVIESAAILPAVGYWYWTEHLSSVRGYRANAFNEAEAVLECLADMYSDGSYEMSYSDYALRSLGEVYRTVRLHYSNAQSPGSLLEKARDLRKLLTVPRGRATLSLRKLLPVGVVPTIKYLLLKTGAALLLHPLVHRLSRS